MYLRAKIVKGEKYLYLVKSTWDPKKNTSRQETIKYLGKSSNVTMDDIPVNYRDEPKIISFLASNEMLSNSQTDKLRSEIKAHLYQNLITGDFEGVKRIYNDYSLTLGFVSFFEKILTPVMHHIGDQWEKKKISVADEHVASNMANMLVKTIQERNFRPPTKDRIVICVPEGEHHNLGANMLEAHLSSIGFETYNLTPSEPHESIIKFIKDTKSDAVLVSVTLPDSVRPAQRLVRNILDKTEAVVLVGGQAINQNTKFDGAITITDGELKNIARLIRDAKS